MFLSRTGLFLIFGGWLIFIFDHFTHSGHESDSCLIVSTFTKSVVTIHKPGLEYKAHLLEFVRKFWLKRTMKPLVTNKFEKKISRSSKPYFTATYAWYHAVCEFDSHHNLVFFTFTSKILVQLDCGKIFILDSHSFYFYTFPKKFPLQGGRGVCWGSPPDPHFSFSPSKRKILVQLGGKVRIFMTLNDVTDFTAVKREVARCYNKVGHLDCRSCRVTLSHSFSYVTMVNTMSCSICNCFCYRLSQDVARSWLQSDL